MEQLSSTIISYWVALTYPIGTILMFLTRCEQFLDDIYFCLEDFLLVYAGLKIYSSKIRLLRYLR
jgi:hypothetical protein